MEIHGIEDAVVFTAEKANKLSLAEGEHCRVTLWCLEPGQEIHPHAHAGDHVWVVHTGSGWFLSGGDAHPVAVGSVVFAPAGEIHGMRAESRLTFVSVSAG